MVCDNSFPTKKLYTLSVKISSVINFVKIFLRFVTFHQRNFLTAFSDGEENNFYFHFILFVFDFKIKLILSLSMTITGCILLYQCIFNFVVNYRANRFHFVSFFFIIIIFHYIILSRTHSTGYENVNCRGISSPPEGIGDGF